MGPQQGWQQVAVAGLPAAQELCWRELHGHRGTAGLPRCSGVVERPHSSSSLALSDWLYLC